ncbi:MAG: hypothetical protein ACJA0U_002438 [Salibacteraceae bacterium]|jgi:hypothetical protein
MIDLNQYKFKITGLYVAYCGFLLWFINPFEILQVDVHWTVSILILALIAGVVLGTLLIAHRTKNRGLKQLIVFLGFALSPTLAAVLILSSFSADPKTSFMFIYGFTVISIPLVAFVILWIIYEDIKHKIKTSGETEEVQIKQEPIFKLENDKGKTLVEVNLKDVICFEANDNYVLIYHLNASNDVEKSMQRISLKKVENLIEEIPVEFKKVHKSYLINPNHIDKIDGKAQSYRIQMKHFDKEVPVSRNFKISDISR